MKRLLILAIFGMAFIANAQEKPLTPAQEKVENKATAKEEVKVAAEVSEAEVALAEGKEIVVTPQTGVAFTSLSKADNSGLANSVGLEGAWKIDLNQDKKEIILTGGDIYNKGTAVTQPLRLLVYFDTKPFDVKNPGLNGTMYSVVDVDALNAGDSKVKQSYIMSWVAENNLPSGTYYPYIILGQQNAQTNNFEFVDVKVFDTPVVIP